MAPVSSSHLGRHVIVDIGQCASPLLDDADALETLLREAAVAAGATVLSSHRHRFAPHGATALCVLAESHISIHTWPELRAATLDAYTCGDQADPVAAVEHVLRTLDPGEVHQVVLERGGTALGVAPTAWLLAAGT